MAGLASRSIQEHRIVLALHCLLNCSAHNKPVTEFDSIGVYNWKLEACSLACGYFEITADELITRAAVIDSVIGFCNRPQMDTQERNLTLSRSCIFANAHRPVPVPDC